MPICKQELNHSEKQITDFLLKISQNYFINNAIGNTYEVSTIKGVIFDKTEINY